MRVLAYVVAASNFRVGGSLNIVYSLSPLPRGVRNCTTLAKYSLCRTNDYAIPNKLLRSETKKKNTTEQKKKRSGRFLSTSAALCLALPHYFYGYAHKTVHQN